MQPILLKSEAVGTLFSAIAQASVTEAYLFTRGQPDATRRAMFEGLITIVLQSAPNELTATRAIELVNLPFTSEEEKWFEEYLTSGDGRKAPKGRDTLMMRRIATGKFSQAVTFGKVGSKNIGGVGWETIQNGLVEGLGSRTGVNMELFRRE